MKNCRNHMVWASLALMLVSGAAIAQAGGGCLQGTWHYLDASGRIVGESTVGCGELDGAWGAVTSRSTFTQGCNASM